MKLHLIIILFILIAITVGCVSEKQENVTGDNPTVLTTPITLSTLPIISTTRAESTEPTMQLSDSLKTNSSFPDFERADQIFGNWIKDDKLTWYLLTIKDDSVHRFLLKKFPKFSNYGKNYSEESGKIVQTSSTQFQMILGGDLLRNPEENSELTEFNRASWHYNRPTGELISDKEDRYNYLPKVNLADYLPLPAPTFTPQPAATFNLYPSLVSPYQDYSVPIVTFSQYPTIIDSSYDLCMKACLRGEGESIYQCQQRCFQNY